MTTMFQTLHKLRKLMPAMACCQGMVSKSKSLCKFHRWGILMKNDQRSLFGHALLIEKSPRALYRFISNGPLTYSFLNKTRNRQFFTKASDHAVHGHKRNCWKCGEDTSPDKELFFCECGVVQSPAKHLTFFRLLKEEQGFDVDVAKLSQTFKQTQRLLHPDKFSNKSKEEQELAEAQSALLNKSYDTLSKPLSRAIYLLELDGVTITENDTMNDPEFLMDMMEDFEKVENATVPADVEALEKTNEGRIEKCVKELSNAFQGKDLVKAKNLTIHLRYFTTIQERIKEFRLKSFG